MSGGIDQFAGEKLKKWIAVHASYNRKRCIASNINTLRVVVPNMFRSAMQ